MNNVMSLRLSTLLLLLVFGCSTTQPPPLAQTELPRREDNAPDGAGMTTVTTIIDGVVVTSRTTADMTDERNRIVHEQQVNRLMNGTAQKPIINGKLATLHVTANGTGTGTAPTSITVLAPRDGMLKIQIVNNATSESVIVPDVGIHKGVNEIALNLDPLVSGAYTLRVSEGALTATAGFSVAR